MPTIPAGGRARGKAKASTRRITLSRSVSTRSSASQKAAAPKTRTTRKTVTGQKGTAKIRAKTAAKSKMPSARKKAAATRAKASTGTVVGAAKTTTSHARIQKWAEARDGVPATVKSTRSRNGAGVLRIDFPGFRGRNSLQKISWKEWFRQFDRSGLAFLYQDKTQSGKQSRFFKLVKK